MRATSLSTYAQLQPEKKRFQTLQLNEGYVFNELMPILKLHYSCKTITLKELKALSIATRLNASPFKCQNNQVDNHVNPLSSNLP